VLVRLGPKSRSPRGALTRAATRSAPQYIVYMTQSIYGKKHEDLHALCHVSIVSCTSLFLLPSFVAVSLYISGLLAPWHYRIPSSWCFALLSICLFENCLHAVSHTAPEPIRHAFRLLAQFPNITTTPVPVCLLLLISCLRLLLQVRQPCHQHDRQGRRTSPATKTSS
jgi:hypothetical protein